MYIALIIGNPNLDHIFGIQGAIIFACFFIFCWGFGKFMKKFENNKLLIFLAKWVPILIAVTFLLVILFKKIL